MTLEGQLVRWADRIAYINHDIDDALRANVITEAELPKDLLEILGYDYSARDLPDDPGNRHCQRGAGCHCHGENNGRSHG